MQVRVCPRVPSNNFGIVNGWRCDGMLIHPIIFKQTFIECWLLWRDSLLKVLTGWCYHICLTNASKERPSLEQEVGNKQNCLYMVMQPHNIIQLCRLVPWPWNMSIIFHKVHNMMEYSSIIHTFMLHLKN